MVLLFFACHTDKTQHFQLPIPSDQEMIVELIYSEYHEPLCGFSMQWPFTIPLPFNFLIILLMYRLH